MFDYNLLIKLTQDIPSNLNKSIKKEHISKDMREQIVSRDGCKCRLCGKIDKFGYKEFGIDGSLEIHHIIPNGLATLENLLVLCYKCHTIVHLILYLDGKWKHILRR